MHAANRPNILFIMSDDHAAHAISAYGSRVNQTPQLDRLANQGMRFDRCYSVNVICTPTRATILTGKYSHLNGVPVFMARKSVSRRATLLCAHAAFQHHDVLHQAGQLGGEFVHLPGALGQDNR